jgi:hypothetical protein
MRTKRGCALCFGLPLLTCLVVTSALTVLRVWPVNRARPVATEDLLIDLSVFPRGWYDPFDPEPIPEREYGEQDSLYVGFAHEGLPPYTVGASHTVYRYRNELDAAILFTLEFSGKGFANHYMITPWAVPEGWSYTSTVAQRFTFACGEVDFVVPKPTCKAIAQYDEYISVFRSELSPDYMTLPQAQAVLAAIDERMSLRLGKDAK